MGAAAKFDGVRPRILFAHGEHAYFVTVFLAEQSCGAGGNGIHRRHQPCRYIGVLADDGINFVLDALELLGRECLRMTEIEAQPVGRDERALLRHMLAEPSAQRLMQ